MLTIPVDIHNGSIDSAIPIKSLKTIDWIDDDGTPDFLQAPSIGTITTTGNKKTGSAGDFQADVAGEDDGSGNPTATTLGSAKIAGSLNGAAWHLTGVTSSIQVGGGVGSAAAPLTLTAEAIKSLKVGGNLDHATIQLSQIVDPKNPALGTLSVTGAMNASSISSAGNVTSVTLGAMDNSEPSIGTGNGVTGLASAAGDFATQPGLASLTIKGLISNQVSFMASAIDAWSIGKASLKLVDAAAEDAPFAGWLLTRSPLAELRDQRLQQAQAGDAQDHRLARGPDQPQEEPVRGKPADDRQIHPAARVNQSCRRGGCGRFDLALDSESRLMALLIKNGRIVTADEYTADIYCEDETITRIGRGLEAPSGTEVIDAAGKLVFPGFIDPHVHIYLPSRTCEGATIQEASRHRGWTTGMIEMICPSKADDPWESWELWASKAKEKSACDYTFHMGVSRFDDKTDEQLRRSSEQDRGRSRCSLRTRVRSAWMMASCSRRSSWRRSWA